jgi:hypothetical protein
MPFSVRAGRAVGVRQTGIGRTLVTQARFVIENDPPAAAAVKAGATRLPDAYEAARERLSEMSKRRRLVQVGPSAPGTTTRWALPRFFND